MCKIKESVKLRKSKGLNCLVLQKLHFCMIFLQVCFYSEVSKKLIQNLNLLVVKVLSLA